MSQRLSFQVIQDEFVFDITTVKDAAIINHPDGKFEGLEIELTQEAAVKMGKMTSGNIGRQLNLVLNGKIISVSTLRSSLGEKLLIAGITPEDAQQFVEMTKSE